MPAAKPPRNPAGPLGQSAGAADPRSPGRTSGERQHAPPGNPVFEVDDDWFGGAESQARADARAGRREIAEDLSDPESAGRRGRRRRRQPIFEVDDDWFAEDDKARAARLDEQRALAAEMGIHDVDLPHAEPAPNAPAPPSDLDFDFGLDDIKNLQDAAPAVDASHAPEAPPAPPAPQAPPSAPRRHPQAASGTARQPGRA